jgi:hypothetical protein
VHQIAVTLVDDPDGDAIGAPEELGGRVDAQRKLPYDVLTEVTEGDRLGG